MSKVATSLKKTIPRSKLGNSDKSLMIGTANDSPLDGGDVDVLELSHFQNRAHGFGHSPGLPIGSHKCLSTISCTLLSYPGWFQTQKKHRRLLTDSHMRSKRRGSITMLRCGTVWDWYTFSSLKHDRPVPPNKEHELLQDTSAETNPLTTAAPKLSCSMIDGWIISFRSRRNWG